MRLTTPHVSRNARTVVALAAAVFVVSAPLAAQQKALPDLSAPGSATPGPKGDPNSPGAADKGAPDKPGDAPSKKGQQGADGRSAPEAKGAPAAKAAAAPPKPGLAVAQPRSAAERDKALSDLYAHLATATDAKQAATVAQSIEQLWATPGSDTISLLIQRAAQALAANNPELSLKLLDAVVALAPDYADGWSRRGAVHLMQKDVELALGDVRRTLALDPNHFRALDGLFHILTDIGRKKEALQVGRQLLDVNPFNEGTKAAVDQLAREVEGRGI